MPALAKFVHVLMAAIVLTVVSGCGVDPNSPYGKGYAFGEERGEHSRDTDDYDLEGAKSIAKEVAHKTDKSEGCPYDYGTPEYGAYMKGLKAGYNDGFRR